MLNLAEEPVNFGCEICGSSAVLFPRSLSGCNVCCVNICPFICALLEKAEEISMAMFLEEESS